MSVTHLISNQIKSNPGRLRIFMYLKSNPCTGIKVLSKDIHIIDRFLLKIILNIA
jgi:hypothetical protein